MKTTVALYKSFVLQQLTFRSELWLWFFLDSAPLFVLLFVWSSIFKNSDTVGGFTLSAMVFYYLVSYLVGIFTSAHFEKWRVNEIRKGSIDMYLTKPFSYLGHIFTGFLASKSIYACLNLPFFLVLVAISTRAFDVTLPAITLTQLLSFILLLIFALLFNFMMALTIVLLGFWFENAEGLEHFKWATVSILSGEMIPISFMPPLLQNIANALPFKYLKGVPALVMLGTYQLQVSDLIYMLLTLLVFYWFITKLWHKARYRYSSAGG